MLLRKSANLREAVGQELRDGPSKAATIKIQLLQVFEDTGLFRYWPLNVQISDMKVGNVAIPSKLVINVCNKRPLQLM